MNTPPADTIAAVATPPGQGGVGILRISGSLAQQIGGKLLNGFLPPRRALHRRFLHEGEMLDQGLALSFPAPKSFTGEDVVELHGHGGPVVMQRLLDAALALGARLARPGEFSERAFHNGKIDLAQAEAVADLIASASVAAAKGAVRSLAGVFSAKVHALDEDILKLRVYVEASIDFPDEEADLLSEAAVGQRIASLIEGVQVLSANGRQGVLLSQGVNIAIIGPPNAGKSSLLNRLSGEDAAIVTELPGTTRDLLKVDLVLDGLPVRLVDTAGLRAGGDLVEKEGMRRARAEADKADLILEVCDLSLGQPAELAFGRERTLVVGNKVDLTSINPGPSAHDTRTVHISCLTGAGVGDLRALVKQQVGFTGESAAFSARQRHLTALDGAASALRDAVRLVQAQASGEIIAEELRLAHLALGEITGEVSSDDLLGSIFATFCIGK